MALVVTSMSVGITVGCAGGAAIRRWVLFLRTTPFDVRMLYDLRLGLSMTRPYIHGVLCLFGGGFT